MVMTRTQNRRDVVNDLSDRAKAYLSTLSYDEFDKLLTYRLDKGLVKTVKLIERRAKKLVC